MRFRRILWLPVLLALASVVWGASLPNPGVPDGLWSFLTGK